MNDLQKQLLEIYREFKRVCDKLNLNYFAAGGTLLGAVRHKGFIPWDDDIDIYMFRKDFEKFKKEAPKHFSNNYFVQTSSTDKNWYWPFIKIRKNHTTAIEPLYAKTNMHQGIWIDIFPLDKFPNNEKLLISIERKRKLTFRRILLKYGRRSKLKGKILDLISILYSPTVRIAQKRLNVISTMYNNSDGFYSTIWDSKKIRKVFFDPSFLKSFVDVPFENTTMRISTEFDRLLTTQYGDWKKIPKNESEKKSGHTIYILDLKTSYENYLDLNK